MEAESKETNSSSILLAHEEEQEEFLGWAQRVTPRCEAYKQWVERDYALKINALAVPPAVLRGLPIGDAQLLDVRIGYPPKKRKNNRNKKRNLPYEDEVYASSERIRQKVARGNCLLSFKLRSSPSSPPLLCFPLRGLKKFTGGMGDDDDCPDGGDEEVWRKFFTKPPEQAKKVVSTWKANGAAAHLSVIKLSSSSSASTKGENKLQTKFLLIGGSKNVHLMAGTRGDLSLYDDKENRLSVALKVMHALFDMLEALNHQQEDGDEKVKEGEEGEQQWKGKALRLLEFMARKHWTACFEMLDPEDQHVECLDHLRKPFMQFITFVPEHQGMDEKADNNSGEEDGKKKGLCVEPTAAIQFAAKMGFETVKYEVFELEDPTKIYHVMNEVRTLHGTEGRVLYFLDEEDNVTGLLKKKSVWYIMLRAVREKLKTYTIAVNALSKKNALTEEAAKAEYDASHEVLGSRITRRIKEIQQWLNLSEETTKEWEELCLGMNEWLYDALKSGRATTADLSKKFPVLWNRYLREEKRSDKIQVRMAPTSLVTGGSSSSS